MSKTTAITLDSTIQRGSQTISSVELRRPNVQTLRGVSLTDVLNMDVNALITIIPRITTPTLTQRDVQDMDPSDLVKLGQEVAAFLVPKAVVLQVQQEIGEQSGQSTTQTCSPPAAG